MKDIKILNAILSDLICRGKVTVEIPGLDMDALTGLLHSEAAQTLREIAGVVCEEEMTNQEKVEWIRNRLV